MVVTRAIIVGLGRDVKRSNALIVAQEALILEWPANQANTPLGANLWFV